MEVNKYMKEKIFIRNSGTCVDLLHSLQNKKVEYFGLLLIDRDYRLIAKKTIAKGDVNTCTWDRKKVYHTICRTKNCCAVIFYHNHPAGTKEPSYADVQTTLELKQGCNLLGYEVLDHIIICKTEYYSFLENGLVVTDKAELKIAEK